MFRLLESNQNENKSLDLIKRISNLKVSDEQFCLSFFRLFWRYRTLSSAHHIEIEDNVVSVVTPAG